MLHHARHAAGIWSFTEAMYVELDNNIHTAKVGYGLHIGHVFASIFPNTDA